ncbi:DEAD/DEAH box helicase [Vibrio parahaemolyticus]|uniref:DEAD/DEAH box helicase n=1 Tax=Vibrio parahaemolyticus TaxID=670 RepID=UPI0012397C66|nr:DEAD/DEAH box helicase [Vibrio parahaemolyticus]EIA1339906.1 DEAD/DEAH box helicase [Vibrio parahaemolyticus]EIA1765967.1 DEAD/DEAH box helicase [Vibrio parahaemolyticus]EIU6828997.1 DEAD/DEAH box helicase [Vibrio parahaemolyticus]QET63672.1 DEAD/DEAH box helicase [Vibrio parahaemolyticus]
MGFTSLGLSAPILKAIQEKGYDTPSPIQAKAIPAILEGKDVMAAAQTGTGKTAGFTLPILERLSNGSRVRANQVRALILTPTRELAAQVQENVFMYGRHLPLSSAVVFGGVKINPQMQRLRKGADVLVATPGRLMDLYNQNAVKFDQLEVLVLDEADRMLDMGFIRDIRKILALLPKQRQNLLFSATFSDEIRDLAKGLVNNPVEISVNPANSTARTVEQSIYPADVKKKAPMLVKLIKDGDWKQVLVFTKTKHGANRLAKFLIEQNLPAAAIHGNKSQGARTKALADFKSGEIRVLVATDIAARGIDIPQLPQVVNFELPKVAEDYVHRIGRTGRAGEVGKAISLVCALEASELFAIERLIQEVLPRKELEGFAPTNVVPESKLDTRPIKPKKPKKPKKTKAPNTASENAQATEKKAGNGANKPKRRFNGGNNGNKNSTNQGGAGKPKGNREGQGRANSKPDDRKPNGNKPNGNKPSGNKPNGNKSGNAGKPSGNRKPNNAKPAGNKPSGQRRKPRPQAAN